MSRQKIVIVVTALAIVFALVAALLVWNYLQKQEKISKGQLQNVVVAAVEIPIGAKIQDNMIKMAPWPKESLRPGSFPDLRAVSGPGRVALKTIPAGEPVTEDRLVPAAGAGGAGYMTYVVPPGHRAVTVAVNEVAGVAGFITPNNKVDVVLTTPIPGNTQNEYVSKIVLQNVPVLATGQISQEQKEGKPVVVPTVTLDLVPDDAEKLVLAANKGTLQLLLRNFSDSAEVDAKGATITKVLSAGKLVQAKPAVAPAARVVRTVKREKASGAPSSGGVELINEW